ncbi:TetR/AcrR family transcriptional regulator [Anoxynatronum buryatiense]|uniref:Transcriptional regulator, TetR family n=1 Tax=Anoxynatronum buryatiense TaxID=489973 RepID=A0AA46AK51_9CLOT|nr:TetR/AcrR family transcriptional regulator [Anoxynatronum buryatiense]SMP66368.1 transcriptional regulator, TetR family [Anoxynatronum buryatiense]
MCIKMDKKQLKRNEIIEKTIHTIYRQGYHGTGIQELADAAGIPKGSFYNYFESKEEYAIQALRFYHQQLKDHLLVVLKNTSMPPKERVKAFFIGNIQKMEGFHYQMGCLVGNFSEEMGDLNDRIAATADEILSAVVEEIAQCLSEEPTLVTHSHQMAEFLVNSFQGAMVRMKSSRNRRPLDVFVEMMTHLLDCPDSASKK